MSEDVKRLLAEAEPWTPPADEPVDTAKTSGSGHPPKASSNGGSSQPEWDRLYARIKERLTVEQVLANAGIEIVPRGKWRYFSAPWRKDADPSVQLFDDGWYDHGPKFGGDVIALVARMRGIEGKEAAKELARELDIPIPAGPSPRNRAAATRDDGPAPSDQEAPAEDGGKPNPKGPKRDSAAIVVLGAVMDSSVRFHNPARVPFVTLPVEGVKQTMPVRSEDFGHTLMRTAMDLTGGPLSALAQDQVVRAVAADALIRGELRNTYVRTAWIAGTLYYDLQDLRRRAVRITPGAVDILDDPRRYSNDTLMPTRR